MMRQPSVAGWSDDDALARALAGDRDAIVGIHDRYYSAIHRFVVLQVSDPDVAADMASEVFVRFLDALRGPRPPQTTLQGWLYGVARNVVRMHHRHAYRHPEVGLDESWAGPDPELDAGVRRDEERAALDAALRLLTDEQRDVLALRYGAGLPIARAAEALGKTEGAIKQLQARAVAALARQMQRTANP